MRMIDSRDLDVWLHLLDSKLMIQSGLDYKTSQLFNIYITHNYKNKYI